ncbi:MAG: hypothetical protein KKE50_04285 [Nanoarchaeota archaeon]|nr:hypothetical protein [Nanoarchaeota archaeon]
MNKNILDYWACLSLGTAGLILFTFLNILIYGAVLFKEQRLWILIIEVILAEFIFLMSVYVAYQILIKKRTVRFE